MLVVILQWWGRAARQHVRHTCIVAGLSFLLGLGLNQLILLFIHCVRPYDAGITHLIIGRSNDWSFPSDHATATIAIAAAFLIQRIDGRGLLYVGLGLFICVSRVTWGRITRVMSSEAHSRERLPRFWYRWCFSRGQKPTR